MIPPYFLTFLLLFNNLYTHSTVHPYLLQLEGKYNMYTLAIDQWRGLKLRHGRINHFHRIFSWERFMKFITGSQQLATNCHTEGHIKLPPQQLGLFLPLKVIRRDPYTKMRISSNYDLDTKLKFEYMVNT